MRGPLLALSLLTALPVRVTDVDTRAAAAAIRWAPVVGALLGARRFGGVTGDDLGAVCELSVLVTLVVTAD